MDLKLINKILDGADQRARHNAITALVKAGIDETSARSFINYLYQKIPTLKDDMKPYITGIVRWFIEGDLDPSSDLDLSKITSMLSVLKYSPARDNLSRDFYSDLHGRLVSFNEVKSMLDLDSLEELPIDNFDVFDTNYTVVEIKNFSDLEPYISYIKKWCVSTSKDVFDSYTINGTNKFYLCLSDNFKNIKAIPGDDYPHDSYGYSIIAVIVDPEGNFPVVTSRWNADIEGDRFLSKNQLKTILGESNFNKLK